VPICVRAGKRLPVTTTEAWIALKKRAREIVNGNDASPHHIRFRLGPGRVDVGVGTYVKRRGAAMIGDAIELRANLGIDEDRDAYERLLEAALAGDHALSETADGIYASWRVVDRVVKADLPVQDYAPGTWGPTEADRVLPPDARWHDPQKAD